MHAASRQPSSVPSEMSTSMVITSSIAILKVKADRERVANLSDKRLPSL